MFWISGNRQRFRAVRRRLKDKSHQLLNPNSSSLRRDPVGERRVNPGNIVWIFGNGRSGSTWLSDMMSEMTDHDVWFEPRVDSVFDLQKLENYSGENHILNPRYRGIWLGSARNLVLDMADARFPQITQTRYLVVKDPGGSEAAPVIMQALPESRIVLLVRDPRDVVASWLDAARKGGWVNKQRARIGQEGPPLADSDPDTFVKRHARTYLNNVGGASKAYNFHRGRKAVVRYEDLRADALGTMAKLYKELEIPIVAEELSQSTKKHAWERIPEREKGVGKFYRKAAPGGWREDLTPIQARTVENITRPLAGRFYPDLASSEPTSF